MQALKKWFRLFLKSLSVRQSLDIVEETSAESFPASDPPGWAASLPNKTPQFSEQATALEILRDEHRIIMKTIYAIHEQIENLQQNKPFSAIGLKKILFFMRHFVENTHHQKEEEFFFPALQQSKAPPAEYNFHLFKEDHLMSLKLLDEIERILPDCENKEVSCLKHLEEKLEQLKDIYTRHTLKEENFIFPLAEKYLSASEKNALIKEFAKIDQESKA